MRRDLPLERIIAQTRLYDAGNAADPQNSRRFALKPVHDSLYRHAIDAGLARWLTLTVGRRQRPSPDLIEHLQSRIERVNWWAANAGTRPAPDVLLFRTDAFANDWGAIRALADGESRVRQGQPGTVRGFAPAREQGSRYTRDRMSPRLV